MFQLKTSWISLIAAWFFDSSRAKMPPAPTKLFLSPQIVTGAVQPHLSHVKGICPSQLSGGTFSDAARHVVAAAGPAGRAAGSQHRECHPCTGPTLLSRKIHCQMAPAISIRWDFTLEAACKLNKYCNIFVRQLY